MNALFLTSRSLVKSLCNMQLKTKAVGRSEVCDFKQNTLDKKWICIVWMHTKVMCAIILKRCLQSMYHQTHHINQIDQIHHQISSSSIIYIIRYISYLQIPLNAISHIIQYIIVYTIKYIKHTKYVRYINIYIIKYISLIFCCIMLFKLKGCSKGLEWLWFLPKKINTLILSTAKRRAS